MSEFNDLYGGGWTSTNSKPWSDITAASLMETMRKMQESCKPPLDIDSMEVVKSKHMPKSMRDEHGVEREVLYMLSTPSHEVLGHFIRTGELEYGKVVVVLGEPIHEVQAQG